MKSHQPPSGWLPPTNPSKAVPSGSASESRTALSGWLPATTGSRIAPSGWLPPTNDARRESSVWLPPTNDARGESPRWLPPTNDSTGESSGWLPRTNESRGESSGRLPPTNDSRGQLSGWLPRTNDSRGQSSGWLPPGGVVGGSPTNDNKGVTRKVAAHARTRLPSRSPFAQPHPRGQSHIGGFASTGTADVKPPPKAAPPPPPNALDSARDPSFKRGVLGTFRCRYGVVRVACANGVPVRTMPMTMTSSGAKVWPGAHVLLHFLLKFPALVARKRCVELGSGTGICGLVCGLLLGAEQCVLSDHHPHILRLLRHNVALNTAHAGPPQVRPPRAPEPGPQRPSQDLRDTESRKASSMAMTMAEAKAAGEAGAESKVKAEAAAATGQGRAADAAMPVAVRAMPWGSEAHGRALLEDAGPRGFDVLLMADVTYDEDLHHRLWATIRGLARADGTTVVLMARQTRFKRHDEAMLALAADLGFAVTEVPCTEFMPEHYWRRDASSGPAEELPALPGWGDPCLLTSMHMAVFHQGPLPPSLLACMDSESQAQLSTSLGLRDDHQQGGTTLPPLRPHMASDGGLQRYSWGQNRSVVA